MVDPNCLYLYLVFLTKQVCIFVWVIGQNYTIIIIITVPFIIIIIGTMADSRT